MNSSWLIPIFLGLNGFGDYDKTLCNCIFLTDYDRFSNRYKIYGVDE